MKYKKLKSVELDDSDSSDDENENVLTLETFRELNQKLLSSFSNSRDGSVDEDSILDLLSQGADINSTGEECQPYAVKNQRKARNAPSRGHFVPKPLVGGFGCLELVLYGIRELT